MGGNEKSLDTDGSSKGDQQLDETTDILRLSKKVTEISFYVFSLSDRQGVKCDTTSHHKISYVI